MSVFQFPKAQTCPECQAKFTSAERQSQYEPVVVVTCPNCSAMLWQPGLDEDSPLFPFDPNAEEGI